MFLGDHLSLAMSTRQEITARIGHQHVNVDPCTRQVDLDRVGRQVLLDDRTVSPGVKFKDAELLGVPWIVVVGRGWADGKVELRNRFSGETREIPVQGAADEIAAVLG